METTLTQQLLGEYLGTLILILLGDGAVAASVLKKTKSYDTGWLMITIGWGLAVAIAVYAVGWLSPAHINPAVTVGMAVAGEIGWGSVIPYIIAQVAGGFTGAILVWIHYKMHFDATSDQGAILSEIIATIVLVFSLLAFTQGEFTEGLNPLIVGLLIVAIGISLGGTTGYAINPARDFGPRLAHQALPIKNKGSSEWHYAWIPVLGPLVGGSLGALLYLAIS